MGGKAKYRTEIERARTAWALVVIGLRHATITDARKLADQIAVELLGLGFIGKEKL